jgi:ABC-type branched-subunit amino acid transport system substrate-binding protein
MPAVDSLHIQGSARRVTILAMPETSPEGTPMMLACRIFRLLLLACLPLLAAGSAIAQIRVGQTIDLSGSTAERGKAVLSGIRAYLDPVNAAGGVDGRRIELITLDDGGKPDMAASNTRALIERDKVIAIFSGIEGGPCVASMKVAVERKVPLLACAAGSPDFRDPFSRYVFPMRAAHLSEFAVITRLAKQFGRPRLAFVYSDSDTGRRHLANLKRLAKEEGALVVAEVMLKAGADEASIRQMADLIFSAQAQAVLNHGAYSTYAAIYTQVRALDPNIQFYAVNSGAQQLVRLLGPSANGIVFTQVVPLPTAVVPVVVGEYRAALKLRAPNEEPSFSSLEGYLNARLLVAALRHAGKNPTPESLVNALERAGRIDLGGFEVRYSPTSHDGSTFVDTVLAKRDGRFIAR